ncbi:MAG: Na(+)-translocating NADH-quinone reductase subunit A [Bacteriovoracaceae bacterium]|nr:Na(+)-translocating NADH-quinone reductase subunit A [Bacteriovoracaceae bacterium]
MVHIKKGLDLPILGAPKQEIDSEVKKLKVVALLGGDYVGMKPSMLVKVGDKVKIGTPVFACKKTHGVVYTSPAAGKVIEVNRGAKRVFQSLVIELADTEEQLTYKSYKNKQIQSLKFEEVKELLIESGMWTALRARPYSKVPATDTRPHAVYITGTDTNPLSPDPKLIIDKEMDAFKDGIETLSKLTEGKTYVCVKEGIELTLPKHCTHVEKWRFSGVHPAGNVGTHIHFIDPVHAEKVVWHMGYQDVIAVGKLFKTGKISLDRVISIAGPNAKKPRLVKTRIGANVTTLVCDEKVGDNVRVVSGSVFKGTKAFGNFDYLGRYHQQVSLLEEGDKREFFGWIVPGSKKFSLTRAFLSKFFPGQKYKMTTTTSGSPRAIVPVGLYESVMPLDILPTQLFYSLMAGDTDQAQKLGCMELDEEDVALCTYVCPGKNDFGAALRKNLTTIEKEG